MRESKPLPMSFAAKYDEAGQGAYKPAIEHRQCSNFKEGLRRPNLQL